MYLFPRCVRMLIDAIVVSTNTRTHTHSLSLSLRYLALPSSIYKALRRHNLDQSKYTFLRIQFSHFKGYAYTKDNLENADLKYVSPQEAVAQGAQCYKTFYVRNVRFFVLS